METRGQRVGKRSAGSLAEHAGIRRSARHMGGAARRRNGRCGQLVACALARFRSASPFVRVPAGKRCSLGPRTPADGFRTRRSSPTSVDPRAGHSRAGPPRFNRDKQSARGSTSSNDTTSANGAVPGRTTFDGDFSWYGFVVADDISVATTRSKSGGLRDWPGRACDRRAFGGRRHDGDQRRAATNRSETDDLDDGRHTTSRFRHATIGHGNPGDHCRRIARTGPIDERLRFIVDTNGSDKFAACAFHSAGGESQNVDKTRPRPSSDSYGAELLSV